MLEHILCAIFGHCYVVERVIAPYWRKVGCTRCCRSWGMHDPTRAFVPWDGEQEEMARRNHPAADELRPGEVMFIDPDNKSAVYKVPDVSGVAPVEAPNNVAVSLRNAKPARSQEDGYRAASCVPASDERKQAEQAYTVGAFDYPSNPVGSRDWTLFWQGWQARAAGAKAGVDPEPLLYLSVKQLPSLGEGYYIPYRLKPEGNFQFPVYATSGAASPAAPTYSPVKREHRSPSGPNSACLVPGDYERRIKELEPSLGKMRAMARADMELDEASTAGVVLPRADQSKGGA